MAQPIVGRVIEPTYGIGVDSVMVSIPGSAGQVFTDSNGQFTINTTSLRSDASRSIVPYYDANKQIMFWNPEARFVRFRMMNVMGRIAVNSYPDPALGRLKLPIPANENGFYGMELLAGDFRLRLQAWIFSGKIIRVAVTSSEKILLKGAAKQGSSAAILLRFQKSGWITKDSSLIPGAPASLIPLARTQIKILIVDGFNNHNWQQTTVILKAILGISGFFTVDVITSPDQPPASTAYQTFNPVFRNYEAVILNVCNINTTTQWPARIKTDFVNYIDSGGSALAFHAAAASFSEWPEYVRIVGMTWAAAAYGPSYEIIGGIPREIAAGIGGGTNHGARYDALVNAGSGHPITRGMPPAFRTISTEVYVYPRTLTGVLANTQVLGYAFDSTLASNKFWPLMPLVRYGKGYCFTNLMGHVWAGDIYPPQAADIGMHTLTIRALEWLARREIMYPVPVNFPTATKTARDTTLQITGP